MSLAQDDRTDIRADIRAGITAPAPGAELEPYGDLAMFHRSLAGLCRSELPLPHALASLQDDLTSGSLRHECADMAAEIESGVPFEDAYARRSERFPPAYRALVEAGLASGDLPGVLDEIARDAGLRARIRDQLRRRLELPLIAAVVVFVIGALLTLTIAPVVQTSPPLVNGRVEHLAAPPTGLFVLTSIGLLALFTLVLGGITLLRKPLDPGAGPRGWRYRVPLFGRLHGHAAKAGFATTLALLLRRELPLPRALALCAASSDGAEIQAQVRRMAAAAEDGASLAESIRAGDLIPPSLLWFVESAGSPAASARALDDIAAIYRQRLQRATDRAATFALPAIELIIGLVVLTFAMAYVLPAYDLFGLFRL